MGDQMFKIKVKIILQKCYCFLTDSLMLTTNLKTNWSRLKPFIREDYAQMINWDVHIFVCVDI